MANGNWIVVPVPAGSVSIKRSAILAVADQKAKNGTTEVLVIMSGSSAVKLVGVTRSEVMKLVDPPRPSTEYDSYDYHDRYND
jgi:hypothetical protein